MARRESAVRGRGRLDVRGRKDERGWVDGNRRQERVTGRENAIIKERATGRERTTIRERAARRERVTRESD